MKTITKSNISETKMDMWGFYDTDAKKLRVFHTRSEARADRRLREKTWPSTFGLVQRVRATFKYIKD